METAAREQAEAVQRMQDAIEQGMNGRITLSDLARAAGCSAAYASRLFHHLTGMPPLEYARRRRLALAALRLRDEKEGIMETAISASFESHEGFARAFRREYGLTPSAFRESLPPLPLFTPRSARHVHLHGQPEPKIMNTQANTVFVSLEERPPRRLILVRASAADEYWSYCQELGCEVWGLLSSIKGALAEPKGLWLPESMRPAGTSTYVMGVEAPLDFAGLVPESADDVELPASLDLVFRGRPYDEADMGPAITLLRQAIEEFDPAALGLEWALDELPSWQLAPMGTRGVIEGRPVRRS